jgi:hypothetical protein
VIVVSNPVDILTYVATKRLPAPSTKIIGSGTALDSSRFRYLLGRQFDIDPRSIHAYVIGEHGDWMTSHDIGWSEWVSQKATAWTGSTRAFMLAALTIVVWAATGPAFRYSNTWQLVINTGTTIVTFLMVFLIQRAQNKEAAAVQVKLDELIRAVKGHATT